MRAAKEKTLIYLAILIYIKVVYVRLREAAALQTNNYDENATCNSEKTPIGSQKKIDPIVPVVDSPKPRKRIGENTHHQYESHRALGTMYFRARYYDPKTGEFISQDPYEYVDGKSLYRGYMALGKVDPRGNSSVAPGQGSGGGGGCEIAVRCGPAGESSGHHLGTHCGLVIQWDGNTWGVDGSGGDVNKIGWKLNPNNWGNTGPFNSYPDSVCTCLLEHTDDWNRDDIPRDHINHNSNYTLKCMLKGCGLKINWGGGSPPIGYDSNWKCLKWGTRPVGSPNSPNCIGLERYCEKWQECP